MWTISLRIYPHEQDTGGFFVAVFEKTKPMTGIDNAFIAHQKGLNVDENEILESEKKDEELLESIAPKEEENEEDQSIQPEESETVVKAEDIDLPSKRAVGENAPNKPSKKAKSMDTLNEAPFELMSPDNEDIIEAR
jgi:hypothetical protein